MRLKALLVSRDEQNKTLSESRVTKIADVVDFDRDVLESVSVEEVEIVGITWVKEPGVLHLQLQLGGYRSDDMFVPARQYASGLFAIGAGSPLWAKYHLSDFNGIDHDSLKQMLHDEDAVMRTGRDIWGLPNLESKLVDNKGAVISDYKRTTH